MRLVVDMVAVVDDIASGGYGKGSTYLIDILPGYMRPLGHTAKWYALLSLYNRKSVRRLKFGESQMLLD